MTPRRLRHAFALSVTLLLTVPLLALLCKGHTPSRFASINLPPWERQTPRPALCRAPRRASPAAPGQVQLPDAVLNRLFLRVDQRRLFHAVEHPKQTSNPLDAGQPGIWLEAACALGRQNPKLGSEQDLVALRLMGAQDEDGFLGDSPSKRAWNAADATTQGQNICGLLAYYDITHTPAVVYAAVLAGNLLLSKCADRLGTPQTDLALPLVRLYQETADTAFLTGALRLSQQGAIDGPGLCALYAATGHPEFLHSAQARWKAGEQTPTLAATLYHWTAAPGYAAFLTRAAASPDLENLPALVSCTYLHTPAGITVNLPLDSQATLGTVHLIQQHDPATGSDRFTVQMPHPTALALRLARPSGAKTALHLFINGVAQPHPALSGSYLTLARHWKPGDVVVVKPRA
ncbi:MAG: glycoside hydrolase family 127 protein [Armatimonadota bacterium]|nr:glycoside hydrolase family 127 protein [Armatimonadota bacterium]